MSDIQWLGVALIFLSMVVLFGGLWLLKKRINAQTKIDGAKGS